MKARRKPITFFLVATLFAAVFVAYLHFGVLPGDLRDYVVGKIESLTGKRVSFSKTLFLPFEGLTFYDFKVSEKSGPALFAAKKLRLDVELLTFFREKKIVVSRAYLEDALFTATLAPVRPRPKSPPVMTKLSGQIEVPVVPEDGPTPADALESGPDALLPENVYLKEVEILNGRVLVRGADGKLLEDVRDINVRARFERPPVLHFDGSLRLGTRPYASLSLSGLWDLDTSAYQFRFQSKSALVPSWLVRYQAKNLLVLKNARSALDVTLKSVSPDEAVFHAEADLKEAELAARGETFSGEMSLTADGVFDFAQRKLTRYKGTLDFVAVAVAGGAAAAPLPPLENLSGALHFRPDFLEIRALRGQHGNLVFEANGDVRSFKTLELDARVRVNAGVADFLPLLPAADRAKLDGLRLDGRCETVTSVTGSLKDLARLKSRHALALRGGTVADAAGTWTATDVAADLAADDAGFKVSGARFTLGGKRYALDATAPKADGPGKVDLRGDDFRLTASYDKKGPAYKVRDGRFSGNGLNADFEGPVTTGTRAALDLKGNASLDLVKARAYTAKTLPGLKDAGLEGILSGRFLLKGFADDPSGWDFKMDASGSPVRVKEKFRMEDFKVQVRYKNRALNLPYFHAKAYGGTLGGRAFFDMARAEPAFNAKFYANGVALEGVARDLALEPKELAGKLLLDANLKGAPADRRSWTGGGSIDVKDGWLWKTDLFKQMGDLPFVKVIGLDEVTFRGMHATFDVRGGRIRSNDLRLNSETVALLLEGSLGFEGDLDFVMHIGYTDDVFAGALDTGGIVPFVVGRASELISKYKISGTLKKPKSEKMLLPAAGAVAKGVAETVQGVGR